MIIRSKDFTLDEEGIEHTDRCFTYLRNALMCCVDAALQGQA
jgi:hypothetical protein